MNRLRLFREVAFWGFLLVIGLTYFGPRLCHIRSFVLKEPDGYYGKLTDSFLSGQLSMKEGPAQSLLSSANPYVAQLDVPRPHDMSLYKGKLYLYFGPTPVMILYLPWRLLTNSWLSESNGSTIFCFLGVVLAATLLRRIKTRFFETAGEVWLWVGIAVLAWGSPVFYLAQNTTFYAVPISAAFFCIMLVVVSIERAVASPGFSGRCAWMAAASLGYGLAVGSRPNYVFGLPVLLLAGIYLCAKESRQSGRSWIPLIAALLPASIVGGAIAEYNFRRFQSPFEFGMRFALMPEDMRHARLMGTEFLRNNLHNYLFTPAHYVRYFPYFLIDRAYGMFTYLPLSILGPLLILAFPFCAALRKRTDLLVLCLTLFVILTCNLISLGLFYYFGELRYMADFVPVALLLGLIGVFFLTSQTSKTAKWIRFTTIASVTCVTAFSFVNALLATLQASPLGVSDLTQKMDWVAYEAEQQAGIKQGTIEMDVRFPTDKTGRREPLLSTGLPGRGDIIYVEYISQGRARIGFFHMGSGGPVSKEFTLSSGVHRMRLSMGSLFPPAKHPLFAGYPLGYVDMLKRGLEVTLDGETVLKASSTFYFATPGLVYIGANALAPDVSDSLFSGGISNCHRLGLPAPDHFTSADETFGPLRLHLHFPKGASGPGEPLVCSGRPGAGDIFYVTYLGDKGLRFGIENSGDVLASDPVKVDFDKDHVLDLEMGSLYPPNYQFAGWASEDIRRARSRYSVRLDGKPLIEAVRNFHPSESADVVCALNAIGATTAVETFTGSIYSTERLPPPLPRPKDAWGPLDAWVIFPQNATGFAEPIAVTGVAGNGDVIFVKYDDGSHIRFGFDHWSVGGPVGRPTSIDYGRAHHLEVTMGSLFPPAGHQIWLARPKATEAFRKGTIQVKLDNVVVFEFASATYEAKVYQLSFWSNSIGASSSQAQFSGTVVDTKLPAW